MSSEIQHLHLKHPETPWFSLSYKKAAETLCEQKGILHVYSEKDEFRIRQQLGLMRVSFAKKRTEPNHWIFCLEKDIPAYNYLTKAESYGPSKISVQKAVTKLIEEGSLIIASSKVPALSKAYYSSDFFQKTSKSISVDPSEEKGVSTVTIASS